MASRHLTSVELQALMDHQLDPVNRKQCLAHLDQCELCSVEYQRYQILYRTLADDSDIKLSGQFARNVIRRTSGGPIHAELWYFFIVLFGIIAGFNTVLYYFDVRSTIQRLNFENVWLQMISVFQKTVSAFQISELSIPVFIGTVLLILIIMDHLIRYFDNKFHFLSKIDPVHH